MHTRIAPTPSGYLHTGNACSFLLTQKLAKQHNGSILLRIDDLDNERMRPAYLENIFETLLLLRIEYDSGPKDVADFEKHYSQHLRLPIYEQLLNELCSTNLVYACTCSRKQLLQQRNQCDCVKKNFPLNTPEAAWRIQVPVDTVIHFTDEKIGRQRIPLTAEMADFIIRKKDGLPSYQVASLADDLYYKIDYVVRGEDLLPSTAAQLYLAKLIGKTEFLNSRFYHHSLLKSSSGIKLSKSAGDAPVKASTKSGIWVNDLMKIIADW